MSSDRNNGIIAREGIPFILPPFLAAGLAAALAVGAGIQPMCWVALALFAVTFAVLWFFRNPERHTPDGPDLVISPADGRLLDAVAHNDTQWGNGDCVKVSIFMDVRDVHVNRSPISGRITKHRYVPGRFLVASLDKASEDNERSGLTIVDDQGRILTVVQIAGLIARRIVNWPSEGDRLARGQRYGLIRFGSRVELYLPPGTEIRDQPGDKTRAGETVIGVLPPTGDDDAET